VSARELITEHLDLWTGAVTKKSNSGRGSNGKVELTGIKKLRELTLELAVRGKLVDQSPNEEPAQELLERCLEAKKTVIEQGKLKKARKHASISEDDTPFSLPRSWSWSRLDDLVRVINGRAYKKHEMLYSGTPLLRVGNLFTSNDWYYSDLELEEDKYIDSGNLIYAWSASFGPFIWDGGRAIYHYHIWKLDLFDQTATHKRFLYLYLKAVTEEIKSSGSGIAMIHMTKTKMEELVIPVPPLEEQHRIVQKVDELMALCDRLEQQTSDQLEAHETLMDTLLGTLTQSENATKLADNWTRLTAHFDTLFTTEKSIEKLKQAILQLGMMGVLTPSNHGLNSPPIPLEVIKAEKEAISRKEKIKAQKLLEESRDDEGPYKLPADWKWARVGDVIALKHGYAFKSSYFSENEGPFVLTTPGSFHETGGFRDRGLKTKYYEGPVDKEFLLKPHDLIIPMTEQAPGLLGSAALIPNDEKTYLHNQRLGKLIFSKTHFNPKFIYWFFNSKILRNELARTCSGTTVRHTSPSKVSAAFIPIPDLSTQSEIAEKIDELMALCDRLKERLNQASETRCQLAGTVVEEALK
jgi:type I restriction enzyme S subunit